MSEIAAKKIKDGLENNDEKLLREAYFILTGEWLDDTISPKEMVDTVPEKLAKELEESVLFQGSVEPLRTKTNSFQMKERKPEADRIPRPTGKNRFVPDQYADVPDENPDIDDSTTANARNRVERARPKAKKHTVLCSDCNKNIDLTPVEAERIFSPGSTYRETGKYECSILKCNKPCPNQT